MGDRWASSTSTTCFAPASSSNSPRDPPPRPRDRIRSCPAPVPGIHVSSLTYVKWWMAGTNRAHDHEWIARKGRTSGNPVLRSSRHWRRHPRAAVARDAAGRGLKVMLAEKGDDACATSSASSKLIHGGLRYLEHLGFARARVAGRARGAAQERAASRRADPLPPADLRLAEAPGPSASYRPCPIRPSVDRRWATA